MTARHYKEMLARIDEALSQPAADDWASVVNRRNLEDARAKTTMAMLSEQRRLRLALARGSVVGNAAPVHLALRFVHEINESVVEVANRYLVKPYKNITDDVRERLGLLALPPVPGSFSIELAVPPITDRRLGARAGDPGDSAEELPFGTADSVTAKALDAVVEAIRSASVRDSNAEDVERAVFSLGVAGARHLSRMAARCERGNFTVEFAISDADGFHRAFEFLPAHAAWLRSVIRNRALDASEHHVTGVLSTASTVRNLFDIVTDDGARVSGRVDDEIRPAVSNLYNKRVRATFREELDPSDASGESLARVLVSIEPAPESVETTLPGYD